MVSPTALSSLFFDEGRCVSYPWLAEHLAVRVDVAQKALANFVDEQRARLRVTWLCTGTLVSSQSQSQSRRVAVASDDQLAVVRATFASLDSLHPWAAVAKDSGDCADEPDAHAHTADLSLVRTDQRAHAHSQPARKSATAGTPPPAEASAPSITDANAKGTNSASATSTLTTALSMVSAPAAAAAPAKSTSSGLAAMFSAQAAKVKAQEANKSVPPLSHSLPASHLVPLTLEPLITTKVAATQSSASAKAVSKKPAKRKAKPVDKRSTKKSKTGAKIIPPTNDDEDEQKHEVPLAMSSSSDEDEDESELYEVPEFMSVDDEPEEIAPSSIRNFLATDTAAAATVAAASAPPTRLVQKTWVDDRGFMRTEMVEELDEAELSQRKQQEAAAVAQSAATRLRSSVQAPSTSLSPPARSQSKVTSVRSSKSRAKSDDGKSSKESTAAKSASEVKSKAKHLGSSGGGGIRAFFKPA